MIYGCKRTFAHSFGFTVIELLVVIGIMAILMGLLLPAAERVRHQAYIDKCASNLRQIGLAFATYEQDNHGNFPRTLYNAATADTPVEGTGISSPDAFAPGGPSANDVTADIFLTVKSQKLPTELLICPYNDETDFIADSANFTGRSNFTDQKKNLGYSFANPYPNTATAALGYRLSNKLPSDFAIGADRNPGINGKNDDVNAPVINSPKSIMAKANSSNHEKDGQNVLYADGHVTWCKTPFVGVANDNIYTTKSKPANIETSPVDATDSLLLPTDD